MLRPEFVEIKTPDGLRLPGLLYKAKESKKVAIYLHGNGSSSVFYQREGWPDFVEELARVGISLLAFNNRGAHYIKKLYVEKEDGTREAKRFGMAYEIIKEAIHDIDGAVSLIKKLGFEELYLIGHSTGANKICVYNYYKMENDFVGYVLVGGGDDVGLYYDDWGEKKFWKILKKAELKIEQGKGEEIIKEILPEQIFSYQGFFDMASPDGDYNTFPFLEAMKTAKLSTKPLFRYFKSIKKPALVVYGAVDEYQYGDVNKVIEMLKDRQPGFVYRTVEGADHSFNAKQRELGRVIAEWLNLHK